MMTTEEKFGYWLNYATEDLVTAQAMYKSGRWLYVLFCCQQALEKLVKGLHLLYIGDNIPKIHNINSLFDRFSDKITVEIDERWRNLFDRLTNFYISGRYPKYINELGALVHKNQAEFILKEAEEAFKWLLTLKPPKA